MTKNNPSYKYYNPNPCGKNVGDCVIRAITKVMNSSWETIYMDIALKGFEMCDMPASNAVWGAYLSEHGFRRKHISNTKPYNYTIADFCNDNPEGVFVLTTGTHAVASINGVYYDAGDSGNEIPIYYWEKEKEI